jgi:hypothetical protein
LAKIGADENIRPAQDEATSSKLLRDLWHQMRSDLNDLSAQLPTLEYQPPKRKQIDSARANRENAIEW